MWSGGRPSPSPGRSPFLCWAVRGGTPFTAENRKDWSGEWPRPRRRDGWQHLVPPREGGCSRSPASLGPTWVQAGTGATGQSRGSVGVAWYRSHAEGPEKWGGTTSAAGNWQLFGVFAWMEKSERPWCSVSQWELGPVFFPVVGAWRVWELPRRRCLREADLGGVMGRGSQGGQNCGHWHSVEGGTSLRLIFWLKGSGVGQLQMWASLVCVTRPRRSPLLRAVLCYMQGERSCLEMGGETVQGGIFPEGYNEKA